MSVSGSSAKMCVTPGKCKQVNKHFTCLQAQNFNHLTVPKEKAQPIFSSKIILNIK